MKKILNTLGIYVGMIIAAPILLVVSIGYLFYVPFDMIRYYKMPYYKDLKIKYQFFITSSEVVKIYNRIVSERLPIEYVKNNDFEYFIKDGQVLLCGWGQDGFEQVDGVWFFAWVGKEKIKMEMEEVLENEKDMLKPEHKSLPAKFLIFHNEITDTGKIELAKECPYFYCISSAHEDI